MRGCTILLTTILLSCASTGTSIIYSDSYDKRTDQTPVMILPLGTVTLPGKWTKTSYNSVSGQHYFIGPDSVRVAIALQPWDKYEFSRGNPDVTSENFVRKFYEWDANYLKEQMHGQVSVLVENKEKNYIVWNIKADRGTNTYFLFGLRGKTAYNLYVTTSKWDEARKVSFLQKLFTE